jgi:hypothetical protein
MFKFKVEKVFIVSLCKFLFFLTLFMLCKPGNATAEIIWSGDYETGNFRQSHTMNIEKPQYSCVPEYGRPTQMMGDANETNYYGNGSDPLLTLVTNKPELKRENEVIAGPVRQGNYAAKYTVKSKAQGGVEPDDCDVTGCINRRTELPMTYTLPAYYDAMPYMSERWLSISHYVPKDWDNGGSGWGTIVFQLKAFNGAAGPIFSILIRDGVWQLRHTFMDAENPSYGSNCATQLCWQRQTIYDNVRPQNNYDERDFMGDFPDRTASQAALGNLNKDGWTDWIINIKFDARGPNNSGTGFLKVWQRQNSGKWVHVLNIVPKNITVRDTKLERGIGIRRESDPGGFGTSVGMYMDKNQVWGLTKNRVIYNDNVKVGSQKASFEMMSPDGSSPTTNINSIIPPDNLRLN